jgi:tetratricopeptide (TPR) repeat protein
MTDTYLHPPSDPEVATIVAQLAEGLQHVQHAIEQCREQLEQGYTLGELRGITDEGYAGLYKIAYDLCDQGDFHHALPVALQLTLHNPTDSRYPFVTGSCLQRLGHIEPAALMYALAVDVNPGHAAASYRLAECLLAIGKPDEATPFLNKTIDLCYGDFDKRKLLDMAKEQLDRILR